MSLTHLGRFSEPVFDELLPANGDIFPVARRVVSHAARSLFAGKLLFPVAVPGKEGQHCFAADPGRLFRMPARKSPPLSVLQTVVSSMFLVFPPLASGIAQARQHLEMPKRRLPPSPGMKTQAQRGSPSPDLSRAEPRLATLVHPSRFATKGFRDPLYPYQNLISRFEKSRLRRMAPSPDESTITRPFVLPTPPSPHPEAWNWFAWSPKIGREKPACRTRPVSPASLSIPRPPLLTPTARNMRGIPRPLPVFRLQELLRGTVWRPSSRFPATPLPFSVSPRRLAQCDLLPGNPALALKDHTAYISSILYDSPTVPTHLLVATFPAVHRSLSPALHSQILPHMPPIDRLAGPSVAPVSATSIVANISRSRLAEIKGAPGRKMFRKWPHAAFLPLRQLLFRKPFAKKFDFRDTHASDFFVFASRFFTSLRAFSGSLNVSNSAVGASARARPGERRICSAFGYSSRHPPLAAVALNAPTERSTEFTLSSVRPARVFPIPGPVRKGAKQPLRKNQQPPVASHAHFGLKGNMRMPLKPADSHLKQGKGTTGMVFPTPSMQLLGTHHLPRGPQPLATPRRLAPADDPERMIRLMAALPRRSHSTRHYQLTLESSLPLWKQPPPQRRSRFPSIREALSAESPSVSRIVQLPEDFRSVSAWKERAFVCTDVRVPMPALHDSDLSSMQRIDRGRSGLQLTPLPPPPAVVGAQFLDAPEWICITRQAKMKVRYWPSFYGFPATPSRCRMWVPVMERVPLSHPDSSRSVVPLPGPFNIRRRERPRGPFSMRMPKRWLWRSDAGSAGIPDAYRHETAFPTSTPSRLDAAERVPPAFMGPAFREPWRTIASTIEHVQLFVSAAPSLLSPELMPQCRSTTRPAATPSRDFQEVPMPRVITPARHSGFSPPDESLEISFGQLPFKSIGPILSGRPELPLDDVRLVSLRQVEAFVELRPDLMPGESQDTAAGSEFFIRDLYCGLISHHGDLKARWRSLFFPYKPDLRDMEPAPAVLIEPDPASLLQVLLASYGALLPSPGGSFHQPDQDEPPIIWARTAKGFTPDHPRQDQPAHLPVLAPDMFGFDILEGPAAPAQESDFSTTMFVPFIAARAEKTLNHAELFEPVRLSFPQEDSMGVPMVSFHLDTVAPTNAFPSIEQPASHTVISAGRWSRRLPVRAVYTLRHTPPPPIAFSALHRLVLPALQASSFEALSLVEAPASVISFHEILKPRDSRPAGIIVSSGALPSIAPGSGGTVRSDGILPARNPEELVSASYPLVGRTGAASSGRIFCQHEELGFKFHQTDIIKPLKSPLLERTERRGPEKFRSVRPGKAAIHMPAYPDWLELSSARPSCRPPIGL